MTVLSVNVNKIALLRNSRGRDFPSVIEFAKRVIGLGVKGITVHPRPDERHITRRDIRELTSFLADYPGVEFNIEGYPSEDFMALVLNAQPDQCTLVPDAPDQLTSDHGWNIDANEGLAFFSVLLVVARAPLQCLQSCGHPQLCSSPSIIQSIFCVYASSFCSIWVQMYSRHAMLVRGISVFQVQPMSSHRC